MTDLILSLLDRLAAAPFHDWHGVLEDFPADEEQYKLLSPALDALGEAIDAAREPHDVVNHLFESMNKEQYWLGNRLEYAMSKANK